MRRSPYGFEVFDTCATCPWRSEQFFCALPPDVLSDLEHISFTNLYPTGSTLFSEGEGARGVYVI
ncbi:MAG: Crp/Fnr family transcriptional regulator, partial [Thermoanaerobaculia bacterium]